MRQRIWTEADFDSMSWHDNHVHALRLVEGADGTGDLILDVDHIVEWLSAPDHGFRFRILPVTLTFHGVFFLHMSLDYATPTAAFGPFMIHGIERRLEQRERCAAQLWKIDISWPQGQLEFEARGFTQRGFGEPILSEGQSLTPQQRSRGRSARIDR
jgi:hypothetical protein